MNEILVYYKAVDFCLEPLSSAGRKSQIEPSGIVKLSEFSEFRVWGSWGNWNLWCQRGTVEKKAMWGRKVTDLYRVTQLFGQILICAQIEWDSFCPSEEQPLEEKQLLESYELTWGYTVLKFRFHPKQKNLVEHSQHSPENLEKPCMEGGLA